MKILRWDGQAVTQDEDELAAEEPLELRVRGRAVSVTMRTPGDDDELAFGFLLTEGVIRGRRNVLRVVPCGRNETGNILNVVLAPDVPVDFDRLTRHVFASSSCGLCGKATIESIRSQFPTVTSDVVFDAEAVSQTPDRMRAAQATFDRTGGLHAAALFDSEGELVVLREDVGRHNAVDKVVGHCLRHGPFPLDRHMLLVSGRSSFEIMQKALAARIPVVAAVSAPSSLAASFARDNGQTLIGFLRGRRMNVYTNPQRIAFR
jgi:FdhD protein